MRQPDSRRVAINTAILYGRMLVIMCISFYSSRLLLNTLGITDFGVYSVVGSITSTFIAIKGLFSESIQRFLNVAKGKHEDSLKEQQSIFALSIVIHVALAFFFFFLLEIIGTWLLENELEIPSGREDAAFFVFQITIIATVISILHIPYDAVLIANEKMGFFAFLSLFDSLARLLVIFLLPIIGYDYLKVYSLFLLFTPLMTLLIVIYYCREFPECKLSTNLDRRLFRSMLSLSGWNFFGNISFSLIHEGINMLLNIHGGVILNSSRAIAYQIKNLTNQVSNNALVAVRPRIMQQSVSMEKSQFFDDIFLLSRFSYFILSIVIFPIFIYCPQLLKIWLGDYPEMTVVFTRLVLISLFIRSLHEPINMMNMSYANIKRQILVESVIMVLCFVYLYKTYNEESNCVYPFIVLCIMEGLVMIGLVINAGLELDFPITKYIRKVIMPMFVLAGESIMVGLLLFNVNIGNYIELFFALFVIMAIEMIFCFILMNSREKGILKKLIIKKRL